MATYQFVIQLLPRAWIENKKNSVGSLYDEEGFYDVAVAWEANQKKFDLENIFFWILPKKKSWSKGLWIWGDEEENDIQVSLLENNCIESIRFRLDLRKSVDDLKLKLIEVAIKLDCYLFLPEFKSIIAPEITALNEAIAHSNAARFVNDPKKFLSG
ncbi:MAG: hypothetical protein K0S29_776 [Gammaproteobacteria bacterium]|nr:hypothetical protein [Gammaproteobacteria bacterium]